MEVKFNHREESGRKGVKHYFVDCLVHFTEEEKGIIKARDLYSLHFTVPAATPLPPASTPKAIWAFQKLGRLLLIGAPISLIYDAVKGGSAALAFFLIIAGIALEIYTRIKWVRMENRVETPDQNITVKRLLSEPRFTMYCFSPSKAKIAQENTFQELSALKANIFDSSQMAEQRSYQL